MRSRIMKKIVIAFAGLLIPLLTTSPAAAWSHANYHGGETSHTAGSGSTTRTDAAGGSETHTYGQGTSASGAYGGSAYHKEGSGQTTATGAYGGTATHTAGEGTTATGAYGGSAYHAEGSGYTTYTGANGATAYHSPYYGAAYPAYHPPTTVNVYGAGCYNCGGWNAAGAAAAGVAVGAMTGAAIASANTAAATSNAYAAGVATGSANTATAYNAGVVAGATGGAVVVSPAPASNVFAMGAVYAVLPAGALTINKGGTTYYLNGNTWFQPSYGANVLCFAIGALLPGSAAGQAAQPAWESGKWQFTATIYGWFPAIDGKVNFPGDLGSTDIHVPFHDILDHLKMGGMGALDAHNGRWGVFTDALYLDVGGVKSQRRDFSIGNIVLPAGTTTDLTLDLKSWVWTV